jgi:hypothetical protein
VLESFVTKRRDKKAALKQLGAITKRKVGRKLNNRAENSHRRDCSTCPVGSRWRPGPREDSASSWRALREQRERASF